jgi:ABC-type glutathione transport system ATPase component
MGNNVSILPTASSSVADSTQSFLSVRDLSKEYSRGGLLQKQVRVTALRSVSFEIPSGKTLALVGESGSGKSTVARCVTRLETPDNGQILVQGIDIAQLGARDLIPFRSRIQVVFQDPVTSMNPRFSALEVIEEPLRIRGRETDSRQNRRLIARALMEEVGLSADWIDRSINHFSGGQRQRIALARALALQPQLLVLDEALSGLDLSTQAQIANLLLDLQAAHGLTYLLISHDLGLVGRLSDFIAVMFEGQTVEVGPTERIMSRATHAATKKLLASTNSAESKLAAVTGASR